MLPARDGRLGADLRGAAVNTSIPRGPEWNSAIESLPAGKFVVIVIAPAAGPLHGADDIRRGGSRRRRRSPIPWPGAHPVGADRAIGVDHADSRTTIGRWDRAAFQPRRTTRRDASAAGTPDVGVSGCDCAPRGGLRLVRNRVTRRVSRVVAICAAGGGIGLAERGRPHSVEHRAAPPRRRRAVRAWGNSRMNMRRWSSASRRQLWSSRRPRGWAPGSSWIPQATS